jgi:surface carbohydrate biosynthesis protein
MNILILYERKNRELENAILLQIELENRGYNCIISQFYEGSNFNLFNFNAPKIILVPHLYDDRSIPRIYSRFGKPDHIINLQYEQVLSEKWEKLGHHTPKGEAQKAIHICWGVKTAERLEQAGVPNKNIKTLGALQLDLLRKELRDNDFELKQRLADTYKIPNRKKWTLFLSSFTYADIADERLKMNEAAAKTNLADFPEIHTKSRDKLLEWFRSILKRDKDSIFIYRPHPDELNLEKVTKLEKDFDNFKVINRHAAKVWIQASDSIYSWYSTTVVESHFLGKPYSIIRPFSLPDSFDSVLLKHARFITTFNEFERDYFKESHLKSVAIDTPNIENYYAQDSTKPSYIRYCDEIEKIYKSSKKNQIIYKKSSLVKPKIFSIITLLLYLYANATKKMKSRTDGGGNVIKQLIYEINQQVSSKQEKQEIKVKLKKILSNKPLDNE